MGAGNRFEPQLDPKPVRVNSLGQFLATPFVALGIILMICGLRCSRIGRWIQMMEYKIRG